MFKKILRILRPAAVCLAVLMLLCGILYPGIITGAAQIFFAHEANGSIITIKQKDGTTVDYGSELIAQTFTKPQYLIGRPSVTGSSGPSNLSSVSKQEEALVKERADLLHKLDPGNKEAIPADLVTVSGSGVDPDISPEAAEYQVPRIASARGISEEDVRKIIGKYTTGRLLGFWGNPAVNVLKVNLALDGLL